MSVLLRSQTLAISRPAGTDTHGWTTADSLTPVATVTGSVQPAPGSASGHASDAGGSGPFAPSTSGTAVAYVDPEVDVRPGDVVDVDGARWHVGAVRLVVDPTGSGALDCRVAELVADAGSPR